MEAMDPRIAAVEAGRVVPGAVIGENYVLKPVPQQIWPAGTIPMLTEAAKAARVTKSKTQNLDDFGVLTMQQAGGIPASWVQRALDAADGYYGANAKKGIIISKADRKAAYDLWRGDQGNYANWKRVQAQRFLRALKAAYQYATALATSAEQYADIYTKRTSLQALERQQFSRYASRVQQIASSRAGAAQSYVDGQITFNEALSGYANNAANRLQEYQLNPTRDTLTKLLTSIGKRAMLMNANNKRTRAQELLVKLQPKRHSQSLVEMGYVPELTLPYVITFNNGQQIVVNESQANQIIQNMPERISSVERAPSQASSITQQWQGDDDQPLKEPSSGVNAPFVSGQTRSTTVARVGRSRSIRQQSVQTRSTQSVIRQAQRKALQGTDQPGTYFKLQTGTTKNKPQQKTVLQPQQQEKTLTEKWKDFLGLGEE